MLVAGILQITLYNIFFYSIYKDELNIACKNQSAGRNQGDFSKDRKAVSLYYTEKGCCHRIGLLSRHSKQLTKKNKIKFEFKLT